MSSVGALDPAKPGEQITEEHFANNPKRNSSYAESKFKSELEVWRGIEEGLNAVIVNPSIVLGPGIPNKGTGKLLDKIKKGLKYYPNGITGFVDVRDVCNTTLELFKKEYFNERFILNQGNYSYKKILELMSEAFGNNPPKKPLNPKLTSFGWKIEKIRTSLFGGKPLITKEIHNSANNKVHYSNNKIRETIGYQFIPIEKTIKDMVHFRLQKNRQTIKPAI
jgi:nucleoside-diphosphate-sugar epimerase